MRRMLCTPPWNASVILLYPSVFFSSLPHSLIPAHPWWDAFWHCHWLPVPLAICKTHTHTHTHIHRLTHTRTLAHKHTQMFLNNTCSNKYSHTRKCKNEFFFLKIMFWLTWFCRQKRSWRLSRLVRNTQCFLAKNCSEKNLALPPTWLDRARHIVKNIQLLRACKCWNV